MFHFQGVFETVGFAAFVLKFSTVSQFPTEFGASPHNTTVSLWRCNLADSARTAQPNRLLWPKNGVSTWIVTKRSACLVLSSRGLSFE